MSSASEAELGALHINAKFVAPFMTDAPQNEPPTAPDINTNQQFDSIWHHNKQNLSQGHKGHRFALPLVMQSRTAAANSFLLETRQDKLGRLLNEAPHGNTLQSNKTPVHQHSLHSYKPNKKWGGRGEPPRWDHFPTSKKQKLCQGPDQLQGCAGIPKIPNLNRGKNLDRPREKHRKTNSQPLKRDR